MKNFIKRIRVWWRTLGKEGMASGISVGVQNDRTVSVDISNEEGWSFNSLTLEEAEFLKEELEVAIARVKARLPPITQGPTSPPIV